MVMLLPVAWKIQTMMACGHQCTLQGKLSVMQLHRSDEALQNVRESLDAMERLYTINKYSRFSITII